MTSLMMIWYAISSRIVAHRDGYRAESVDSYGARDHEMVINKLRRNPFTVNDDEQRAILYPSGEQNNGD